LTAKRPGGQGRRRDLSQRGQLENQSSEGDDGQALLIIDGQPKESPLRWKELIS